MLQELFSGVVPEAIKATVPAMAVYWLTQRNLQKAKEQVNVSREEAKREVAAALTPALQLFRAEFTDDLLKRMNGTYLRSEEARIHFTNLTESIRRLDNNQQVVTETINTLAAAIGHRKTD